ncbi:MAG TPA: DNA repair protein RecN [Burkholderiaceae bacterium]|nr:DNA repair protein RecN [Burkholderiaceae bacterium]
MLLHLDVRDFVIVDECAIEFAPGFTVFSGETGAGKSILIDALALALGGKADAGVVRQGAARADISATFSTTAEVNAWLAERELQGDDGTVILRRTVDAQGRSRAFINGASATQALLRECGDFLVDIHGQHAHQQLLRASAQRELLDAHAGLGAQVRAVGDVFKAWQAIRRQREEFERDARGIALERERLQWTHDELARLSPKPGEWDDISAEHKRLSHAAGLIEGAQRAVDVLSEDEGAVQTVLGQVIAKLRPLADIDVALRNAVEAIEGAEAQTADAVATLTHYLGRTEIDPQRLAEVDARLEALHSAARKFRITPESLPAELERVQERLAALADAGDLEALAERERAAEKEYRRLAATLTKARRQAAVSLAREVTRAMQDLAMQGGKFDIAITEREASAHGVDDVEFRVAAHPGVEPRPLAKVASGGELARISLAIAVIAASATATPTLIFDEVDVGIGGAVAEVVGRLLRQLGQARQVLCVTHLPQVAARGDTHFGVNKTTDGKATRSIVTPLPSAARIEEIARMLGGVEITATTRKAAREMLAS